MGVSLSIKDVPEALAERLRQRAARNHRSLQRELMAIVEAGAVDDLLSELDTIVAGSRWGSAPLLTREQAHDRALAREFDFEARAAELADARRRQRHGGAA